MKNFCIIIAGPTGVGKTDYSYQVADKICEEFKLSPKSIVMINGDMGQIYENLSIGTAKPDISKSVYHHELFNILNKPENYTAYKYKANIEKIVFECFKQNKIPIIIGGTGFYLRSLFFSSEMSGFCKEITKGNYAHISNQQLWDELKQIDPQRADNINKNDRYRLERALDIWKSTGIKPSEFKEKFTPVIHNVFFYYLSRPKEELVKRVRIRTEQMFEDGWIEETQKLSDDWRELVIKKHIIGYPEILNYIDNKNIKLSDLKNEVVLRTVQYIKKQETFFKLLMKDLSTQNNNNVYLKEIKKIDMNNVSSLDELIKDINTLDSFSK